MRYATAITTTAIMASLRNLGAPIEEVDVRPQQESLSCLRSQRREARILFRLGVKDIHFQFQRFRRSSYFPAFRLTEMVCRIEQEGDRLCGGSPSALPSSLCTQRVARRAHHTVTRRLVRRGRALGLER